MDKKAKLALFRMVPECQRVGRENREGVCILSEQQNQLGALKMAVFHLILHDHDSTAQCLSARIPLRRVLCAPKPWTRRRLFKSRPSHYCKADDLSIDVL